MQQQFSALALARFAVDVFVFDWRKLKRLDGTANKAELGRSREHMTVIGPYTGLTDFMGRRKMDRVAGAYEEIVGTREHERTGPPQQSFIYGNEVP